MEAFWCTGNSFFNYGCLLQLCSAGGRSRSPAIIVGHMIKYGEKDFDAAVECIRKVRPVVDINPGFVKQLQAYSRCGGSVLHAHQMVLQNRLGELGQRYDSILDARNKRKKRLNSALNKQLMAEMQHQFLSFKHHEKQSVHLSLPSQENEVESIPFCPVFQQSYGCYNCHTMLFRTSNIIVHRANGKWYQSRNACIVPPALSRTCSSSSAGSQPRVRYKIALILLNVIDSTPRIMQRNQTVLCNCIRYCRVRHRRRFSCKANIYLRQYLVVADSSVLLMLHQHIVFQLVRALNRLRAMLVKCFSIVLLQMYFRHYRLICILFLNPIHRRISAIHPTKCNARIVNHYPPAR